MAEDSTFVSGMKLTQAEVDGLDRFVRTIEEATNNRLGFVNSDTVAFTPGALLAVAVAKFVYDVYQDYGVVAISREEFQAQFKSIAKELADLESAGEESLSLDTYARFRRDLAAAKKASR